MSISHSKINQLSYLEVVEKIVKLNKHTKDFWTESLGWSPIESANLLSKSRLDWQVSLSHSMNKWNESHCVQSESGDLILAWTNLGTLVEGTIKLFLSVYLDDYLKDSNYKDRNDEIQLPDKLFFDRLRQYSKEKIWKDSDSANFDEWVLYIQQRRNAIHAFRDREIGTFNEFKHHTNKYLFFLIYHLDRLPYPDQHGPNITL